MSTTSKYTLWGADTDHTYLHSIRIPLKDKICIHEISTVLYELYLQRDFDPQYLFLAENDHKELSNEIAHNSNIRIAPSCKNTLDEVQRMRGILHTHFINYATGKDMCVVTLPELESGTIIAGFFGG